MLAVVRKITERWVARVSQRYEQGAARNRIGTWMWAGLAGMRVEGGRVTLIEMYDYKT